MTDYPPTVLIDSIEHVIRPLVRNRKRAPKTQTIFVVSCTVCGPILSDTNPYYARRAARTHVCGRDERG